MDRELFIRVAASIEKLRATIRDEESSLQRNRQRLAEMEAKLDEMLAAAKAGLTPGTSTLFDWRGVGGEAAQSVVGAALGVVAGSIAGRQSAVVPTARSVGGASITGLVRRFFELNPTGTYNAQDVMNMLGIKADKHDAVRQSLKRLFDESFVMRERDGAYHLNPLRVAHAIAKTEG